jgi:hypothetical protein
MPHRELPFKTVIDVEEGDGGGVRGLRGPLHQIRLWIAALYFLSAHFGAKVSAVHSRLVEVTTRRRAKGRKDPTVVIGAWAGFFLTLAVAGLGMEILRHQPHLETEAGATRVVTSLVLLCSTASAVFAAMRAAWDACRFEARVSRATNQQAPRTARS